MKTKKFLAMSGAALLAACTTSFPPPELVDARAAYAKACAGTPTAAPEAMLAARNALDRAEQSFREHGDTPRGRTLAYVATRKAQTAEVAAHVALDLRAVRIANREIAGIERDHLHEGSRMPHDTAEALAYTAGALDRENASRAREHESLSASIQALRKIARVKEQGDGFVVKLSAARMFPNEDLSIDGAAREDLDAIARVIVRASPDATVRIESHADSGVHTDAHDRSVAQYRAEAIAAYLVLCGVPRERIRSVGYAPRHVVRQAANYDMRSALDRRIDIIVSRPLAIATRK